MAYRPRRKKRRGWERIDWEYFNDDCEVCQQKRRALQHMRMRLTWYWNNYLDSEAKCAGLQAQLTRSEIDRKEAWLMGYKAGKDEAQDSEAI